MAKVKTQMFVYSGGTMKCLPLEDGSVAVDGITINGSGVVTALNQLVSCQ